MDTGRRNEICLFAEERPQDCRAWREWPIQSSLSLWQARAGGWRAEGGEDRIGEDRIGEERIEKDRIGVERIG